MDIMEIPAEPEAVEDLEQVTGETDEPAAQAMPALKPRLEIPEEEYSDADMPPLEEVIAAAKTAPSLKPRLTDESFVIAYQQSTAAIASVYV